MTRAYRTRFHRRAVLVLAMLPVFASADLEADAEALLQQLSHSAPIAAQSREVAGALSVALMREALQNRDAGESGVADRQRLANLGMRLAEVAHSADSVHYLERLLDLARVQRFDQLRAETTQSMQRAYSGLESVLGSEDVRLGTLALFIGVDLQNTGYSIATPWLDRAIELHSRTSGQPIMLAAALAFRAFGHVHQGDPLLGIAFADQAQDLMDQHGIRDIVLATLVARTEATGNGLLGNHVAAIEAADRAVELALDRSISDSLFCKDVWRAPLSVDADFSHPEPCPRSRRLSTYGLTMGTLADLHLRFGDLENAERTASNSNRRFLRAFRSRNCQDSACDDGEYISHSGTDIRVARARGNFDEANEHLQRFYRDELRARGPGHPNIVNVLRTLGMNAARRGDFPAAIAALRQTVGLALAHQRNEPLLLGSNIAVLGQVYLESGDPDRAQLMFRNARSVFQHADDLLQRTAQEPGQLELRMHLMAPMYAAAGDYALAESVLLRSLRATESARGQNSGATTPIHVQLFNLYVELGDLERANEHIQHIERLTEPYRAPGSIHRWSLHNNRGYLRMAEGNHLDAIAELEAALTLLQTFAHPASPDVRLVRHNLAMAYLQSGNAGQALQQVQTLESLEFYENESVSLLDLQLLRGRAEIMAGHLDAAMEVTTRAQALSTQMSLPTRQWRADALLADLFAAQSALPLAIAYGKRAVNRLQEIRDRIDDGQLESNLNSVEDRLEVYRRLSARLATLGRIDESSAVLRLLRERELVELTTRSSAESTSRIPYDETESELLENLDANAASLLALGSQLRELTNASAFGELNRDEMRELDRVRSEARRNRQQFAQHVRDLSRRVAEQADGTSRSARRDLPGLGALQGAIARTSINEVLVHYIVLSDEIHILLTSDSFQIARVVEISHGELNSLIAEHRAAILDLDEEHRAPAQRLHEVLIAPIAADLAALNPDLLVIAPDAGLRYVPFATLWNGHEYLVERHALARFTAASQYLLARSPHNSRRALALGVTRGFDDLPPLPAVQGEVEALIRSEPGDEGAFEGDVLLDASFTAQRFSAALLAAESRLDVVHVASHFSFSPGSERDSKLLLGDGTTLSLEDLRYGEYPLTGVDLLTLSACETGIDGDGSEFEGLASIAQERGAASVLATLWPVADRSTAHFMSEFYAVLSEPDASRAMSVATVQRQMLTTQRESERDFSHPFFWAPFVVAGSWL